MRPLRFNAYYKPVVWGGTRIGSFKGLELPSANIGESWEISGYEQCESVVSSGKYKGLKISDVIAAEGPALVGEHVFNRYGTRFPLIIKIIDARSDLSVQVHPDDDSAMAAGFPSGKTELWYVLETESGSGIYAGFVREISEPELRQRISDDTLGDVLKFHECNKGDVFFLPAGQVHAIKSGNLLFEVQQNCNITYRLYDYGRLDTSGQPRQLHVEEALDVVSFLPDPGIRLKGCTIVENGDPILCDSPFFCLKRVYVNKSRELVNSRDSFMILFCAEGSVEITDEEGSVELLNQGDTILYPASSRLLSLSGEGALLSVTV